LDKNLKEAERIKDPKKNKTLKNKHQKKKLNKIQQQSQQQQ
jgi:hypothetical protein